MSNALSSSAQKSNKLGLFNLSSDVDISMTSQQLDIPAAAQSGLSVPIVAIPSQNDENSARCDDAVTAGNTRLASVIDPLLLSKYLRFRVTQAYQTNMKIRGQTFNFRLGMCLLSNPGTTSLVSISRTHTTTNAHGVSSSSS